MTWTPTHASGLYGVVQTLYDRYIRPHLPYVYGEFAGVTARYAKPLDASRTDEDYKRGMVDAVHEHVGDGDVVEEVGTGRGVLTVHCLRAGAEMVHTYEGSGKMMDVAIDTLDRNVGDWWPAKVHIHHAIVGEPGTVYADPSGDVIGPAELAHADVLVMDCEGAEQPIIRQLGTLPPTIIVETHVERGAAAWETHALLEVRGYDVEERPYRPGVSKKPVLVGTLPEVSDESDPYNWICHGCGFDNRGEDESCHACGLGRHQDPEVSDGE